MFVSKKKYNALKEKYNKLIKLNNENCERCRHKEKTFESRISSRDSKINELESIISTLESLHEPISEGRRLTEEELSTLIAVDFMKILDSEINSLRDRNGEWAEFYPLTIIEKDLAEGLFNG